MDAWLANSGDAAIALATVGLVRERAPQAAILLAAEHGDVVGSRYPELEICPPLSFLLGIEPAMPEGHGCDPAEARAIVADADVVLSQGGAFLTEAYQPWGRIAAYDQIRTLGLPYAFIAQTISNFSDPQIRARLGRALRDAQAIGLRDEASREHVEAMAGRSDHILVGADVVFSSFPDPPPVNEQRGIAVLLSAHFLVDGAVPNRSTEVVPRLAEMMEGVLAIAPSEPVTVFSTVQGLGGLGRGIEDDSIFAASVVERVDPDAASRLTIVSDYVPTQDVISLLRTHRAVVSMRVHPVIMGLSLGVPSVALERTAKVAALLGAECKTAVIAPSLADPGGVVDAVRRAYEATERGPVLWERLTPVRARASKNSVVVDKLLEASALRG